MTDEWWKAETQRIHAYYADRIWKIRFSTLLSVCFGFVLGGLIGLAWVVIFTR